MENVKLISGLHNCHAFGLDSVISKVHKNGDLERFFISYPGGVLDTTGVSPVSYHSHRHAQLSFTVVKGCLTNRTLQNNKTGKEIFHEFEFSSGITGDLSVKRLRASKYDIEENSYAAGDKFTMNSNQIHTVVCEGLTIWKVREINILKPATVSFAYHKNFDWLPSSIGLYYNMTKENLKICEELINNYL